MRKFLLNFLLLFCVIHCFAGHLTIDRAEALAKSHLQECRYRERARYTSSKESSLQFEHSNRDGFYFFNVKHYGGYVIVSEKDDLNPIVGYSLSGSIDFENLPPQLESLLKNYRQSLEHISSKECIHRYKAPSESDYQQLLSTRWAQEAPYNAGCPDLNGQKSLTGCVATAMAQVVNYRKINNEIPSIPGYMFRFDNKYIEQAPLPSHTFDFDNMSDEEIATLMKYCGQSVRMAYGIEESSASEYNIVDALVNYFGWENNLRMIKRSDFNDEHWKRMVREEIESGFPLIYCAATENNSKHCFVVDGFAEDYFHVNWGWGGIADGYYSFFDSMDDAPLAYRLEQKMITTRDDEMSWDVITYGTTINGINYELHESNLTASVLPLKNGEKYRGDLVIPSYVEYNGQTYVVNHFGKDAFKNCSKLTSIFIPKTIEKQEASIFSGCSQLHKVDIGDIASFIKIDIGPYSDGSPFYHKADLYHNGEIVKNLVIPEGVESVDWFKFAYCTSIESVKFPSTIKKIGQMAFYCNDKIKSVDLSHTSIEEISYQAFLYCPNIEEIHLPKSLSSIGYFAFSSSSSSDFVDYDFYTSTRKVVCEAITPPVVTRFWHDSDEVFAACTRSEAVLYVPDQSIELYRADKEWGRFEDIRPLSGEQPVDDYEDITYEGYDYAINLTKKYAILKGRNDGEYKYSLKDAVVIPYNGEDYPLQEVAYQGANMSDVGDKQGNAIVGATIERIGIRSFSGSRYNNLEFKGNLKKIPEEAFFQVSIANLILPKSVETISNHAFYDSYNFYYFTTLEVHNPIPPQVQESSFKDVVYKNTELKVPYGSLKAYKMHPVWSKFVNISNIGDAQEEIKEYDITLSGQLKGVTDIRSNMPLVVNVTITNSGLKPVSGFDIELFVDGAKVGDRHFDSSLSFGENYNFDISEPIKLDYAGEHELLVAATIANEEDMDMTDNTALFGFNSFDHGYYRVSLIEQFTSEYCVYTPTDTKHLLSELELSGLNNFFVHATHHCGSFDDFLTLNRNYEWFYNNPMPYTPAIMINRTDINGSGSTPVMTVPSDMQLMLSNETCLVSALVSIFHEFDNDQLIIKTVLERDEDFDTEAGYDYLTVFVLEDSIPQREQIFPYEGFEDYVHRNTVRKVVTGQWGDLIQWKDNHSSRKFTVDIDPAWNRENLSVVAFIHRHDTSSQINSQVYTANSTLLPQYGNNLDEDDFSFSTDPFAEKELFDIYNLQGMKVKMSANSVDGLPSGIYIVRGRKYLVK